MDDVIVVGGRCAGAPVATLLARAGLKVRVIERSRKLGDTLSGHMIQSVGAARLRAWGLLDAVLATGCPPLTSGTVWLGGEMLPASPQPVPSASPVPALAPRRAVLDPVLIDAARQAGAAVDMGSPVRGLLTDGTRVTGVRTDTGDYAARLVIGADGRNSRIAHLVAADSYVYAIPATYAYYTYWKGTAVTQMCLFLGTDSVVGMFPTSGNAVLVFIQAPRRGFDAARRNPMAHYLSTVRSWPAAVKLLADGTPVERLRGTGDLPTFFRVSAGRGWALAGDAGHHKDPLIARGIADAFRDADLIAAAVVSGWDGDLDAALAVYPQQRDLCAQPISAANYAVVAGLGAATLAALWQAMQAVDSLQSALDPPPEGIPGAAIAAQQ